MTNKLQYFKEVAASAIARGDVQGAKPLIENIEELEQFDAQEKDSKQTIRSSADKPTPKTPG